MRLSKVAFESILTNCYLHQGNTIICSTICLALVTLLAIFVTKQKSLLVYLPLLCHLPIFIWGFYATANLMKFFDWLTDNFHLPPACEFSLWAAYQYIPLVQVLLFAAIASFITDKNKKYTALNLPTSQLTSFIPAIIIGTVSCNWIFLWYLSDPRPI